MVASTHTVLRTQTPGPATLAVMGRVATAASDTWTFRKWAARLATKAPPRDYPAQLRALYAGVLERWRYVAEPEEWVHASPRSSIAHVLGVEYNTLPGTDPTRVDLERIPAAEKGWGDCDDVATVVAAGVRALGMTPFFRVSRNARSGHVSVLARTPKGELVSVDPVGHPEHGFGWAQSAPSVELWGLDGRPVSSLALGDTQGVDSMYGRSTAMALAGPEAPSHETMLGGIEEDGVRMSAVANAPHYCRTMMGDVDGPRVLAVPMRHLRLMKRGIVQEGTPAVDEHGKSYVYHPGHDLWIDTRIARTPLGQLDESLGGFRSFFRRIGRGLRKVGRGIRRVAKRVVKAARVVLSKVMGSRVVQTIVGGILRAYGIPSRLTRGVLAAASSFIRAGGIIGFIRLLRKNPKMALALAAKAARAGLQAAGRMAGPDEGGPEFSELYQDGGVQPVQPVMGLVGVYGYGELGELETTPRPQPGRWYRVRKGDNLLTIAGAAYGLKAGGERLKRAKWINGARANAPYRKASNRDNLFPEGKLELQPDWSCDNEKNIRGQRGTCYPLVWIPVTVGDEPIEALPPARPGPLPPPEVMRPTATTPPTQQEPPAPVLRPAPEVLVPEARPEPTPAPTLPPAPPRDFDRSGSCRAAGGRWVTHPEGDYCSLVRDEPPPLPPAPPVQTACPPGSRWMPYASGQGGECVRVPPPAVDAARKACLDRGALWNATRGTCVERPLPPPPKPPRPTACPPGSRWMPYASGQGGECVRVPPPAVDAARQACLDRGALWNATRGTCVERPLPPPPPPPPSPGAGPGPWMPLIMMLLSSGKV